MRYLDKETTKWIREVEGPPYPVPSIKQLKNPSPESEPMQ